MSNEGRSLGVRQRLGAQSTLDRQPELKGAHSASAHLQHSRSMSVESVNHVHDLGKKTVRWSDGAKKLLYFVTFCALALRIFRVSVPAQVVFDEVHFGGFASHYLQRNYFFDVHPPFGKLLIAGIGYLNDYRGSFSFKDIGMNYSDDPKVPFAQMRLAMAVFGTGATAFIYGSMVEMGFSPLAAAIAGVLVAFDNASVTESRYILLDPILFFFIFGSIFCWIKFRQFRYEPFGMRWWSYLTLTGIFLAGTIGIKMVGLFTVGLIGLACLYDLWELSDWRRQMPNATLWRHFFARAFSLGVVPIVLYLSFYFVHFQVLTHSGPGDMHMSPQFQQTLLGNKLHADGRIVYYGQTVRIQSRTEKILLHSHEHRIPRQHLDGKVSSNGQQVNGYPLEDANNEWTIRYVPLTDDEDTRDPALHDKYGRRPIRAGDHVQVCHKHTQKCIIAHDVASALTRTNMEITMFEEGKTGSAIGQTIWFVESTDATVKAGDSIRSLSSSFRIVNKLAEVRLTNHMKSLPPWGYSQREINGCRKTEDDPRYNWFISEILDPRSPEEEAERDELMKQVKPMNFFAKFWELQTYSIRVNGGLVDDHPYKSRPQEWILPKKGLGFWNDGNSARIMLLGNFFSWTLAAASLFWFIIRFPKDRFREHRGLIPRRNQDHFYRRYSQKMVFLFGAYALHYLPFFLMNRSLYLHHYLPAYMFSCMILAAQFDSMTRNWRPWLRFAVAGGIVGGTVGAFWWLSPLVYGTEYPAEELSKLKLLKSWNF